MNALVPLSRMPAASATRPGAAKLRPSTHLYRAAAAHAISRIRGMGEDPESIARQLFGDDEPTQLVLKAATVPASIATSTWAGVLAGQAVADAIVGLAPQSATA